MHKASSRNNGFQEAYSVICQFQVMRTSYEISIELIKTNRSGVKPFDIIMTFKPAQSTNIPQEAPTKHELINKTLSQPVL